MSPGDGRAAKVEGMRMIASAQIGVSYGDSTADDSRDSGGTAFFSLIEDDPDGQDPSSCLLPSSPLWSRY